MRGLKFGVLAVALGVLFAGRGQARNIGQDLKRYNAMRAMSGDPPFLQQALTQGPAIVAEILARLARDMEAVQTTSPGRQRGFFTSLFYDVARYATIRSM